MELGTNFKKCLEFREAKAELLHVYQDNFDFKELGKLAIDYSDGIVQAAPDVNADLLNYAKGKDIPILGYHEDFADAYEQFYDQLFPEEVE
jgi:starch synthase